MYSKMQYKLLLVISSHPVTKPAIVPWLLEQERAVPTRSPGCRPGGCSGCRAASGPAGATARQPWWCERPCSSASARAAGSPAPWTGARLVSVLQNPTSAPITSCSLLEKGKYSSQHLT